MCLTCHGVGTYSHGWRWTEVYPGWWSGQNSPAAVAAHTVYLPSLRAGKESSKGEMAVSNSVVRGGGRNRGAVSVGGDKILPSPFLVARGSSRYLHGRSCSCGCWLLLAYGATDLSVSSGLGNAALTRVRAITQPRSSNPINAVSVLQGLICLRAGYQSRPLQPILSFWVCSSSVWCTVWSQLFRSVEKLYSCECDVRVSGDVIIPILFSLTRYAKKSLPKGSSDSMCTQPPAMDKIVTTKMNCRRCRHIICSAAVNAHLCNLVIFKMYCTDCSIVLQIYNLFNTVYWIILPIRFELVVKPPTRYTTFKFRFYP
jgi:hypothetical protein